jgi:hypothetical protein
MKKDYTHISMIIDKSGSMESLLKDTIGGFNTFIQTQKETPGECTVSLTTFNTSVCSNYLFKPIIMVEDLTPFSYRPGGGTALYDAIAITIDGCGRALAALSEESRPEKVIVVIITDGEENSSRSFSRQMVKDKITEQSSKYNWEFIFLGANIDAEAIGCSLGIKGDMSMTFAANSEGVGATFGSVSANLSSYRSMSVQSTTAPDYKFFTETDRAAQAKAGA